MTQTAIERAQIFASDFGFRLQSSERIRLAKEADTMPNPFPSINSYLGNPTDWQGFHNALITHIVEAVQAVLPSTYIAKFEAVK